MSPPPCPICQKPQHPDYRPFCSRRCANVDLQRWLTGRYAIGGDAEDDGAPTPRDDET
ncbi:MAG: DNA gyrase inhibitor YacG [Pseudomonadota bacterium]